MASPPKVVTENTEKLMRRLAGSLVSWLTFQQSALRSKMYYEHLMYAPIFEVAAARGWKIYPQYPLPLKTMKYIDFVFCGTTKKHAKNDRVAAVEVSYIRRSSPVKKILNDECKLAQFKKESFFQGKYGTVKRYLLIAAKTNDLKQYCKSNLGYAMPLFEKKKIRRLGCIYYSPMDFRTKKGGEPSGWCVMILIVSQGRSSSN